MCRAKWCLLIEFGADGFEELEFRVIALIRKWLSLDSDAELEGEHVLDWKECVGIRLAWGILTFLHCVLFSILKTFESIGK